MFILFRFIFHSCFNIPNGGKWNLLLYIKLFIQEVCCEGFLIKKGVYCEGIIQAAWIWQTVLKISLLFSNRPSVCNNLWCLSYIYFSYKKCAFFHFLLGLGPAVCYQYLLLKVDTLCEQGLPKVVNCSLYHMLSWIRSSSPVTWISLGKVYLIDLSWSSQMACSSSFPHFYVI